jgi:hypothetical protein
MISAAAVLLAAAARAAVVSHQQPADQSPASTTHLGWKLWKKEHRREGYASVAEDAARFAVFKKNSEYINSHNARGDSSVILATGPFTDLSFQEWRATYLGRLDTSDRPNTGDRDIKAVTNSMGTVDSEAEGVDPALPKAVDWVEMNCTSPVKNQVRKTPSPAPSWVYSWPRSWANFNLL